jgi:hypothetical protein
VKPAQLPHHVKKSDIAKLAYRGETSQQTVDRVMKLAEQKGVSIKTVAAELIAGIETKRNPPKAPASKPTTQENAKVRIQALKAALAGKAPES